MYASAPSDSAFEGNPAMIVALPPGKIADGAYDGDFMRRIALNFFMPILVFVSPQIRTVCQNLTPLS
ncbi:hypothetical protein PAXRUDRAFT_822224 [Paxillus rubicundulus Ve08.2h10]|uniref:Uncharacterized protein n=1 Tax=Paxillus rubicundulus Ve08.2h10 TaxID=930991 RepID=A0A0D0E5L0_9AGAM|nr:hypothetical protein PAXRUDRAFT_822224 [Paxillus rubicundulus Ve08.2h10]